MSLKCFAAHWGGIKMQLSAPRTLVLSLTKFYYIFTHKKKDKVYTDMKNLYPENSGFASKLNVN